MNQLNFQSLSPEDIFIARRAYRWGSVKRGDVEKAFNFSKASAGRAMRGAEEKMADYLQSRSRAIRWIGEVLDWVSTFSLIQELSSGSDPQKTGLFHDELPVRIISWVDSKPVKENILAKVLVALRDREVLRMKYVGMTRGDEGRIRRVFPLGLEKMADQWRLVGYDVEGAERLPKSFVVSRILEVIATERPPNQFKVLPSEFYRLNEDVQHEIYLNPELTLPQLDVIKRELKVKNDGVKIKERDSLEFFIKFAGKPPSTTSVWPLIKEHKKVAEK